MSLHLSGIIPPMVTPLAARDTLDFAGLERLVEHLINGGSSGLFILGTTGEAQALSISLRKQLIEHTCRLVAKRVPVLVGITDTSLVDALHLAEASALAGADAVVAAPPYYWPTSSSELERYYTTLAAEQPLPLMLYNMPGLTKTVIPLPVITRAIENPKIIGIKDSSGNLVYLHQILQIRGTQRNWPVFVGEEETMAYAVLTGADGGVNGGANMFPTLYSKLFSAAASGNLAETKRLQELVIRVSALYRLENTSSSGIRGIKTILSLLGVCNPNTAEPFLPFQGKEREQLQFILNELTPLLP